RRIDDEAAETGYLVITEAAGVDPSGHARSRGNRVRLDPQPRRAVITVRVQIHQAWSDVESAGVDHVKGALGSDAVLDRRDLAVEHGEVGAGAKGPGGIADFAILDEEVVGPPLGQCAGGSGAGG